MQVPVGECVHHLGVHVLHRQQRILAAKTNVWRAGISDVKTYCTTAGHCDDMEITSLKIYQHNSVQYMCALCFIQQRARERSAVSRLRRRVDIYQITAVSLEA